MKNKKGLILLLAGGLLFCGAGVNGYRNTREVYAQTTQISAKNDNMAELGIRAKSAYLMDFATQTPIYAKNENTHLPIASMCKIMTLILSFEAIDNGNLTLDENILVSERAASMGGSQVFLEANAQYPVGELIKSIIVCSANDSCVAMAERVAGSEALFVEKMNARAKELGMENTHFVINFID